MINAHATLSQRRLKVAITDLFHTGKSSAEPLWKAGYRYAKAEIFLNDLRPVGQQTTLFSNCVPEESSGLMAAMDAINARYGRDTLKPASTLGEGSLVSESGFSITLSYHPSERCLAS